VAISGIDSFWRLVRRFDDVFQKVDNTVRAPDRLADEVRALEKRVAPVEGREELLIEKSRAAAAVAASGAVTTHLVDMSRRIGVLEVVQGGAKRLTDA
jgi:hypothetical protein